MSMTDPIADLLTRLRNGLMARHKTVDVPASKVKAEIARILAEEGYLTGYELVEDGRQGLLRLQLKYGSTGEKAITGLERVSRPGRRVYCGKGEIPRGAGRPRHHDPVHPQGDSSPARPARGRAWAARSSVTCGSGRRAESAMSRIGKLPIPSRAAST
jgi:small subunit ribosomal protein S8